MNTCIKKKSLTKVVLICLGLSLFSYQDIDATRIQIPQQLDLATVGGPVHVLKLRHEANPDPMHRSYSVQLSGIRLSADAPPAEALFYINVMRESAAVPFPEELSFTFTMPMFTSLRITPAGDQASLTAMFLYGQSKLTVKKHGLNHGNGGVNITYPNMANNPPWRVQGNNVFTNDPA